MRERRRFDAAAGFGHGKLIAPDASTRFRNKSGKTSSGRHATNTNLKSAAIREAKRAAPRARAGRVSATVRFLPEKAQRPRYSRPSIAIKFRSLALPSQFRP
jgi:hypothetical protein